MISKQNKKYIEKKFKCTTISKLHLFLKEMGFRKSIFKSEKQKAIVFIKLNGDQKILSRQLNSLDYARVLQIVQDYSTIEI